MTKEDVLSILAHGDSKVGKSTFTSTSPTPILVLDAEGSWKFIRERGFKSGNPLRTRMWDPMGPPPRHDDTWDVCRVNVTSWETVQRVWTWLTQGEHDFVSVILDSVTELQRRLKMNIASDGVIKGYDGWGALLARMDTMLRGMRDLTLAHGPVRVVVFIAETAERAGRFAPVMQGQIRDQMPYWVDICGYMYQTSALSADGTATVKETHMWISPHERFVAGERVAGLLPSDLINPNITRMLDTVYPVQSN
jgi:hypothetical protein